MLLCSSVCSMVPRPLGRGSRTILSSTGFISLWRSSLTMFPSLGKYKQTRFPLALHFRAPEAFQQSWVGCRRSVSWCSPVPSMMLGSSRPTWRWQPLRTCCQGSMMPHGPQPPALALGDDCGGAAPGPRVAPVSRDTVPAQEQLSSTPRVQLGRRCTGLGVLPEQGFPWSEFPCCASERRKLGWFLDGSFLLQEQFFLVRPFPFLSSKMRRSVARVEVAPFQGSGLWVALTALPAQPLSHFQRFVAACVGTGWILPHRLYPPGFSPWPCWQSLLPPVPALAALSSRWEWRKTQGCGMPLLCEPVNREAAPPRAAGALLPF